MANISVRIPDEVRKYKEKIFFGMNVRQLICTFITLIVCVPLYIWGNKFLDEELVSWIIIIIAIPLISIGFLRFHGLPMEKFFMEWLKFEWIYPRKRRYRTQNYFRELQEKANNSDKPSGYWKKKRYEKELQMEKEERLFLLEEAEKRGDKDFDPNAEELLTVRRSSGNKGPKGNNDDDNKEKKDKISATQKRAEEVEKKIKENPEYIPTSKDQKALRAWREQIVKNRKKEIRQGVANIKKKGSKMAKRRNAKTTIPKTVQESIPILADYEEGIYEVQHNKYSKAYRVKDINYQLQRPEEGINTFLKFAEFHNYFSDDVHYQIVVDKRVVSKAEQERKIFYKPAGDSYDIHRKEYNNKVLRRAIVRGQNDMQKEIYVVVTIDADNPYDALLRFHKIDTEVVNNLRKIGSDAEIMNSEQRAEYFHDKFRRGREGELHIDFEWLKENGISTLDEIAPNFMMFNKNELQVEDYYYRCMYLTNLPAGLDDEFLCNLCDNNFPTTVSISVEPTDQEKALKLVRRQMTGIETDKIEAEKRAIKAGYNPETIQHSIKDAYEQIQQTYDLMLNKNQKLFFVNITVCVGGETLEELNENCKIVMSKARTGPCQLNTFTIQQEEAWKMTLPFGYIPKWTRVDRSLTTEALSIFIPFANQELFHSGGYLYGLNQISGNLVVVNRTELKTPSGFVLGSPGSGKSFATKRELLNVLLSNSENTCLVIDPENEYSDFARVFGGTIVRISPTSENYINPMDMPLEYGLDDDETLENTAKETAITKALKRKSDYIMSIVEAMVAKNRGYSNESEIDAVQKAIIDKCMARAYENYIEHEFDPEYVPTLIDLQNEFDKEKNTSAEARQIAEAVEYYTRGSMDMFAHYTNVRLDNRFVVFNVRDIGVQLRQISLTIIFDFIWNLLVSNKSRGTRTYVYCDEIHVMFKNYTSADYLKNLYQRGRKWGLVITGITQSVTELLASEQARYMINTTDFVLMFNQSESDLEVLTNLLHITDAQKTYVTGASAGAGLLFAGNIIVPFADQFPEDSYLYQLMSTKFDENMTREEINAMVEAMAKGEMYKSKKIINEEESGMTTANML